MTIRLEITNLLNEAVGEHGLSAGHIAALDERVAALRARLRAERAQGQHGYLNLPANSDMLESTLRVTQARLGRFKHLVVLGIGGSSLGVRTLAQSMGATVDLHVVDNTDPALLTEVRRVIDLKSSLFVVTSKSGGTMETVVALGYFVGELRKAGLPLKDHLIAVTDPDAGALRAFANAHDLDTGDIPPEVGGRFSVLSAAGLLPAALMNIDIAALLEGAAATEQLCTESEATEDWAARLGLLMADLCERGKSSLVFMPYSSRLGYLSDWFVQLWDESLGKNQTRDGRDAHIGQTAIRAVGATDQHSQLQLFLEGPNDKVLLFVKIDRHGADFRLGDFEWDAFGAGYVKGKSPGEVLNAQLAGTAQGCAERSRPNATLVLPRLDGRAMGELLMGLQIATTYAGYVLDVNPYDQPGVELGKRISRRMLGA
ncbi:MAG: glucose-6-phosphate isomerase [Planctomycetes bacterium]|nr:glucose-6-phosphate isomerase [Planctomycetota bacterium]